MGQNRSPRQVSTLLPEQQQLLQQLIGGSQQAFPEALQAIIGQLNPEQSREQFQSSVADPAMREFRSSVIPSILQASSNLGAKGGSSLERQLAQSGQKLELGLGEQFAGFQAKQQQQGIQNLLQLLVPQTQQQAFALQERGPSLIAKLFGTGADVASAALSGGQ